MSIKVIGFDLFGTVLDMRAYATDAERRGYGRVISANPWEPFRWPPRWEYMPAFEDSREGLLHLQHDGYFVVAMSNAPLGLAMRMSCHADLHWDAIIPLETIRTYKPNPATYKFAADLCEVAPSEFLMVSANKDFGDIEQARVAGCRSQLIRNPGYPDTIVDLAKWLQDGKVGT